MPMQSSGRPLPKISSKRFSSGYLQSDDDDDVDAYNDGRRNNETATTNSTAASEDCQSRQDGYIDFDSPGGESMNSSGNSNHCKFASGTILVNFYRRVSSKVMPLEVSVHEKMIHLKIRLLDEYIHIFTESSERRPFKSQPRKNFVLSASFDSTDLRPDQLILIDRDSNVLNDYTSVLNAGVQHNDVVEVVLHRAASVSGRSGRNGFHDSSDEVMESDRMLLREAVNGKEEDVVKLLHLDCGGFETTDENGNNALHHCIKRGMTNAVYHLVSMHPHFLISKDREGYTALHFACQHFDPVKSAMYTRYFIESIVETEITEGQTIHSTNVNGGEEATEQGLPSQTPPQSSSSETLKKLLTCRSANGQSPLKLCLNSSNVTSAGILIGLERGIDGKWTGFQIVRDELYDDEKLLRFVAANSPFLLHALVESCRVETEKWLRSKRRKK